MGYCLLGLFGVNMPMIYGEGEKAFLRLQHDIIKASTDQSLLAWTMNQDTHLKPRGSLQPFACSPTNFVRCERVVRTIADGPSESALTNKGLRIEVILAAYKPLEHLWIAYLDCAEQENRSCRLGILLRKLGDDRYDRMSLQGIFTQPKIGIGSIYMDRATIYIMDPNPLFPPISRLRDPFRRENITFVIPASQGVEHGILNTSMAFYPPLHPTTSENRLGLDLGQKYRSVKCSASGWGCAFKFEHESILASQFIVFFGIIDSSRVWSKLELTSDSHPNLVETLRSYLFDVSRSLRDNLRDRMNLPLEDGLVVNLALKKMIISRSVNYVVYITIA
jgi:hypothetical protein